MPQVRESKVMEESIISVIPQIQMAHVQKPLCL